MRYNQGQNYLLIVKLKVPARMLSVVYLPTPKGNNIGRGYEEW